MCSNTVLCDSPGLWHSQGCQRPRGDELMTSAEGRSIKLTNPTLVDPPYLQLMDVIPANWLSSRLSGISSAWRRHKRQPKPNVQLSAQDSSGLTRLLVFLQQRGQCFPFDEYIWTYMYIYIYILYLDVFDVMRECSMWTSCPKFSGALQRLNSMRRALLCFLTLIFAQGRRSFMQMMAGPRCHRHAVTEPWTTQGC